MRLKLGGNSDDQVVFCSTDHAVARSCRYDAIQVCAVRVPADMLGDAQIVCQLTHLRTLLPVDHPIVEHPVKHIQVLLDDRITVR